MDTRTLYPILYRDHIISVIYWVSYYIQLYRLIGICMFSKAVECPNSNLILNTHLKVLYQIMASCMDEEGLLKRTHSKSLEKLGKAGLNLKQK